MGGNQKSKQIANSRHKCTNSIDTLPIRQNRLFSFSIQTLTSIWLVFHNNNSLPFSISKFQHKTQINR